MILVLLAALAAEPEALPPVPTQAEAIAPLEAAYQKEFAYLVAERDALSQRILAQKRERQRAVGQAQSGITTLEARLQALQVRSENAELRLADVERAAEAAMAADDMVQSAWFQARNSLDGEGVEVADVAEDADLFALATGFSAAFEAGTTLIHDGGRVHRAPGTWFDATGAETSGELLRIGNIATFGLSDRIEALVPQGGGRFQGWRDGGGATGEALQAGSPHGTMGLFLHEGRAKRVDERPPKTWNDILEAGGTVGYVILGLGLIALVLMVLRALVLAVAGRGAPQIGAVLTLLQQGRTEAALVTAQRIPGSVGRVVSALIPHLDRPRAELEDVANEALLHETPTIERFGAAILVIAAVAPLLGLLGTVTGMIATFDIITEFGTGDPRMLSGGISAALVTTQFGLLVAIPALLGGNLLAGWGEVVMGRTEGAALAVLNSVAPPPGLTLMDHDEGAAK